MSSSKNIGAGLAAAGLAIAFFFPYDKIKQNEVPDKKPAKALSARVKEQAVKPVAEPVTTSADGALSIQQKREEYNAMIVNRLKEIQTTDNNGSIHFNIKTKAEAKSCQSGDFDIIKSLVNDGTEKVFLLSVEKLKGSNQAASTQRLSLFDIMKGDSLDFAMPKLETAQEYGVYLCLDPDKSNSCNRKPALAAKDWNKALNKATLPSNILYFQLISTRGSKAFLVPIDRWSPDAIAEKKDKLKAWLSRPDETLQLTAMLMGKLGSLPAEVNGGNLEIPLPYRDPRCDSKASASPSGKTGGG